MQSPFHVAIIMDGNGRWGHRRGLSRSDGHLAGAEAVRRTVEAASDFGITALTLFAFSSANWRRPEAEVAALMELLRDYLASDGPKLVESGVRLHMLGRRDRLPPELADQVALVEAASAENTKLTVRIALDYSSREAIANAAFTLGRAASLDTLDAIIDAGQGCGPVDLLIRTGGEKRLSDFLLWECAYAELWFTDRMWPEFEAADLADAICDFRRRERTFGAVPAAEPRAA